MSDTNIDSCAYRAFSLASLSKLHPYRSAEKMFYQIFTFSLLWPSINVSFRYKLLLYPMIIVMSLLLFLMLMLLLILVIKFFTAYSLQYSSVFVILLLRTMKYF